MKLRNVLIVVSDIEESINFYRDLFGLQVVLNNDGNVIMKIFLRKMLFHKII